MGFWIVILIENFFEGYSKQKSSVKKNKDLLTNNVRLSETIILRTSRPKLKKNNFLKTCSFKNNYKDWPLNLLTKNLFSKSHLIKSRRIWHILVDFIKKQRTSRHIFGVYRIFFQRLHIFDLKYLKNVLTNNHGFVKKFVFKVLDFRRRFSEGPPD